MWIDTTPPKSFKKDDVERYPTAGRRHGTARHAAWTGARRSARRQPSRHALEKQRSDTYDHYMPLILCNKYFFFSLNHLFNK